jgi:hypothetical protein
MLYIFTGELFVVGWIIDAFITAKQVHSMNESIAKEIVLKVKMLSKK